jgi:hypothetical protein
MIDTLLQDASPGRRRPSVHETFDLVAGGLRTRAGLDQRQGIAPGVRTAALFATVLFFANAAITGLIGLIGAAPAGFGPWQWRFVVLTLLATAVVVALVRGLLRVGAVLAIAAVAAFLVPVGGLFDSYVLGYALATCTIIALALRGQPPRVPASWVWFAVFFLAAPNLLDRYASSWGHPLEYLVSGYGLLAVVVLWLIIDARLALAVCGFYAIGIADWLSERGPAVVGTLAPYHGTSLGAVPLGVEMLAFYSALIVVAAAAALRLRRQVAL